MQTFLLFVLSSVLMETNVNSYIFHFCFVFWWHITIYVLILIMRRLIWINEIATEIATFDS